MSDAFSVQWLSGRALTPGAEGRGFDPRPRHAKDVRKTVQNA